MSRLERTLACRTAPHWQRNCQGSATLPTTHAPEPGREIFQHRSAAEPFAEMRDVELRHVVAVRACRVERQPFLFERFESSTADVERHPYTVRIISQRMVVQFRCCGARFVKRERRPKAALVSTNQLVVSSLRDDGERIRVRRDRDRKMRACRVRGRKWQSTWKRRHRRRRHPRNCLRCQYQKS